MSRTSWSRAWLTALESAVDSRRLLRGRDYARHARVVGLDIAPGVVSAYVRGTRPEPYAVRVSLPTFTDAEWERVLAVVASRAGHAAALLDADLPSSLVADVAALGLSLLPRPGELTYSCTCPDEAVPCKHAAAVCLLVADLLDADPFELLLLRGRSREQVLATPAADVVAADAFARVPDPLPPLPLPPARPGRVALLPGGPGPLAAELAALGSDAAARAWDLLTGAGTGDLDLTVDEDLARRAVALLGTPRWYARRPGGAGAAGRHLVARPGRRRRGGRGAGRRGAGLAEPRLRRVRLPPAPARPGRPVVPVPAGRHRLGAGRPARRRPGRGRPVAVLMYDAPA